MEAVTTKAKKILIVEDETAIAMDLQDIIEMNGYDVVGVAHSYDKAIELLAAKSPDLAMLDIALKGPGSGLDVARVINEKYKLPFIFLTSFADQATIKEVVDLKPRGYLTKPFKENDIAPALAVAFSYKVTKQESTDFPHLESINDKLDAGISSQEYNVLKLIWQGKKNAEIAESLFVSINTIKPHVNKIYSKLEVNSRVQAVTKVMESI